MESIKEATKAVVYLKKGIDYSLDTKIEGGVVFRHNGVFIDDEKNGRYFVPHTNIRGIKLINTAKLERIQ